ncbi:MAG: UDP-2,3-diacylglucosamine diphosphatase [Candidatus Brocadiia bacterium]
MGTRLVFLADVHLAPEREARARSLCDFIAAQQGRAEGVYILGDLFDYWVGARQARLPSWRGLLERLGEAARGGPPVRVLGGNRDYLLDGPSLEPFGLESLGMEHRFRWEGLTFHLVHGHMQFPDPWYSRLFLRTIQSPALRWLAQAVPAWGALVVAGGLRRWRRLAVGNKRPADAERFEPAAFAPFFEAGADVVVCGHNHWAADYTEELGREGCRLFAVGPWDRGPSYLEFADGRFRLADPRLAAAASS